METTVFVGSFAVVVIAMAATLGVGLVLLGCFGHRLIGDTPYCRRCRYNLTGTDRSVVGARCPECGAFLSAPKAVRIGEYRRRWGVTAVGLVLVLIVSSTPLLLTRVNWLALTPASWLLADLERPDPVRGAVAFQELRRRHTADTLARRHVLALADHCLAVQSAECMRIVEAQPYVELLHAAYMRNQLDLARADRYLDNLIHVDFRVRPRIVQGRRAAAQTTLELRAPLDTFDVRIERLASPLPVAGSQLSEGLSRSMGRGTGLTMRSRILPTNEPGTILATQEVDIAIYTIGDDDAPGADALHRRSYHFSAEYEVLPAGSDDGIRLVYSPELATGVVAALELRPVAGRSFTLDRGFLAWQLGVSRDLPVNIAYDVYINDSSFRDLTIAVSTSDASCSVALRTLAQWYEADEIPDRVTLRFVPSREAAEGSVDLFEIFGGELVFENLPTDGSPRAIPRPIPRVIAPAATSSDGSEPSAANAP